jgi:hypothetical protein
MRYFDTTGGYLACTLHTSLKIDSHLIKIDENKFQHAMKIRQSAQQMNPLRRLLASTSTVEVNSHFSNT